MVSALNCMVFFSFGKRTFKLLLQINRQSRTELSRWTAHAGHVFILGQLLPESNTRKLHEAGQRCSVSSWRQTKQMSHGFRHSRRLYGERCANSVLANASMIVSSAYDWSRTAEGVGRVEEEMKTSTRISESASSDVGTSQFGTGGCFLL